MSKPEGSVLDCLFEAEGVELYNVKFWRGTDTLIREDRFMSEFCASVARRSDGAAAISDRPPPCVKDALDVRGAIAEL